jgi:hypothetical protein
MPKNSLQPLTTKKTVLLTKKKVSAAKKNPSSPKSSKPSKSSKSQRLFLIIFIVLIILVILILFNFFSLIKVKQEIKNYQQIAVIAGDKIASKTPVIAKAAAVSGWHSFGDNFSSFAYLDASNTDMVLDERVTALVFPPLFSLEKISDCTGDICSTAAAGVTINDWIFLGKADDSCRQSGENNCLSATGSTLKYNDVPIALPAELQNEKIININVSYLSSRFVVSFVVARGAEEAGFAYFFSNRKFSPLLSPAMFDEEGAAKIITKYGRGGGVMAAGGDDDDFILLYSGYEDYGYHYRAGQLTDISRFFGLRVADNGFSPYIIKQGQGKKSQWYVLSLSSEKPKLVKLWQNNSEKIIGAYDFSNELTANGFGLQAFRLTGQRGEIELQRTTNKTPNQAVNKATSLWLFQDQGFDNSRNRQARSVNLNDSTNPVGTAYIKSLWLNSDLPSEQNLAADIYLFGSNAEKIKVSQGDKADFAAGNQGLFWEIDFKKNTNAEYSPWLDHINYLEYFVKAN